MKRIILGSLVIVCLTLCCSRSASADITYDYTGTPLYYIDNQGGDLTIDLSMTLAEPLGDNFSGNVTPLAWDMPTGEDINQSNATPGSVTFFFQTNSSGEIVGWNVGASYPDGGFGTYNLNGQAADFLYNVNDKFGFANSDDPGSWTPEPATLVLLATGMLGLGAAVRWHQA